MLAASSFAGTSTINPTTTNNDDSCDIAVQPAATLLLPYFEVDFKSPQTAATQTLFTVQNVSPLPQIAHVVVWTDWAFPALDFNIFLTGYDVQGINLYDIFAHAVIAPGPGPRLGGTSSNTTVPTNPQNNLPGAYPGTQPANNDANPNITSLSGCGDLPGLFSSALLTDLQLIFTAGKGTGVDIPCTAQVGGVHANAIGYVTVDVAPTCHLSLPNDPYYFNLVLFDNVLTGDYQQVVPRGDKSYAQGGPLVHIRAAPEGGPAGSVPGTTLPYTFYDRYTVRFPTNRTIDRRQPLPSTFAPRFIDGGTGAFKASLKIWREGVVGGHAAWCDLAPNSSQQIADVVRFDEHENATGLAVGPGTPVTLAIPTSNLVNFPPYSTSGDVGGWLYLNLNNGGSIAYNVALVPPGTARDFRTNSSTTVGLRQSQNWVITSMFAEPTYATEATAVALGNGCSPSPKAGAQIAPAPNPTP